MPQTATAVKPSRPALLILGERLRLLGVEFLGIGSARAGHAEEQLAPVGKRHVARVGALLVMVAGLVTIDYDLGAFRKRVLIGAATEQRVGAPALYHPDFLSPIVLLDLDVNPGMGIDPFDLRNLAFEKHGAIGVEFRAECVMSLYRAPVVQKGGRHHCAAQCRFPECDSHKITSNSLPYFTSILYPGLLPYRAAAHPSEYPLARSSLRDKRIRRSFRRWPARCTRRS